MTTDGVIIGMDLFNMVTFLINRKSMKSWIGTTQRILTKIFLDIFVFFVGWFSSIQNKNYNIRFCATIFNFALFDRGGNY